MPGVVGTKFKIEVNKHPKHMWSLSAGLTHSECETYLFINLFKYAIYIGKLAVEVDDLDEHYGVEKTEEGRN